MSTDRWSRAAPIGDGAVPQLGLGRAVGLVAPEVNAWLRELRDDEPDRLFVDFAVGAHAVAYAERLLTRDPDRYRVALLDLELRV